MTDLEAENTRLRVEFEALKAAAVAVLDTADRCEKCDALAVRFTPVGYRFCDPCAARRIAEGWPMNDEGPETRARGERSGTAKLTQAQVNEIRQMFATGAYTKKALAERFPVSDVMVGKIVRGEWWR